MPELDLPLPPERQEPKLPSIPPELELPPGGELEVPKSPNEATPAMPLADLSSSGPENDSGLAGILFPLVLIFLVAYFFGPPSWRTYLLTAKDGVLEEVKITASKLQTAKPPPAAKVDQTKPSSGSSQASGSGSPMVGSTAVSATTSYSVQGSMRIYRIDEVAGRQTATLELKAQSISGTVMEVQVWTDTSPRGVWQPFAQYITVPVDNVNAVYVKFEDEQGNLSPIYSDTLSPPPTGKLAE